MATILYYNKDKIIEFEEAVLYILNQNEHQPILVQSIEELAQTKNNYDLLLIGSANWLSKEDWRIIDELDPSMPIIATDVSRTNLDWINENTKVDIVITTPWSPSKLLNSITNLLTS